MPEELKELVIDIHTVSYWRDLLENIHDGRPYERFLMRSVLAANTVELAVLEKHLPALVQAERERRNDEYIGGCDGTAYRP